MTIYDNKLRVIWRHKIITMHVKISDLFVFTKVFCCLLFICYYFLHTLFFIVVIIIMSKKDKVGNIEKRLNFNL